MFVSPLPHRFPRMHLPAEGRLPVGRKAGVANSDIVDM